MEGAFGIAQHEAYIILPPSQKIFSQRARLKKRCLWVIFRPQNANKITNIQLPDMNRNQR